MRATDNGVYGLLHRLIVANQRMPPRQRLPIVGHEFSKRSGGCKDLIGQRCCSRGKCNLLDQRCLACDQKNCRLRHRNLAVVSSLVIASMLFVS